MEITRGFRQRGRFIGLARRIVQRIFAGRTPEAPAAEMAAKRLATVIPGPGGDPESRAVPLNIQANPFFAALDSGFRFAAPE